MSALSDLQHEVVELKRQVEELTGLLNTARSAGLDDLIAGHGFQRFGRGAWRTDRDGIKFANVTRSTIGLTSTGFTQTSGRDGLYPGVYVLETMDSNPLSDGGWGQWAGNILLQSGVPVQVKLRMLASIDTIDSGDEYPDTKYSIVEAQSRDDNGGTYALLRSVDTGGTALVKALADLTATEVTLSADFITVTGDMTVSGDAIVNGDVLRWPRNTTPTTTQGETRYDTTLDAFMGNVDGDERAFVTEPGTVPNSFAIMAFFFGA